MTDQQEQAFADALTAELLKIDKVVLAKAILHFANSEAYDKYADTIQYK